MINLQSKHIFIMAILIAGFLLWPNNMGITWEGESSFEEMSREEIVSLADEMIDYIWSPTRGIHNFLFSDENGFARYADFYSYESKIGLAYSQDSPQENLYEFKNFIDNHTEFQAGDFVITNYNLNLRACPSTGCSTITPLLKGITGIVLAHVNNGVWAEGYHWWYVQFGGYVGWCAGGEASDDYLLKYTDYGNDCSGFASICWRLAQRYVTCDFEYDATNPGGYVDSLGPIGSCASADLIIGDACVRGPWPPDDNHIILYFEDVDSGRMRSMEQTTWGDRTATRDRLWYWSFLDGAGEYRPIRRKLLIPEQTLSVSLTSSVYRGEAPLSIDLTAAVSGTAAGTINYTFYKDRDDDGTNITTPYDFKIDARNPDGTGGTVLEWGTASGYSGGTEFRVNNVCYYEEPGTYTAKVIAERGSAPPAEARVTIIVDPPGQDDWHEPTAHGRWDDGWSSQENAYAENGWYAVDDARAGSGGIHEQDYYNFDFEIPNGSTINGVEVKCKGYITPNDILPTRNWVITLYPSCATKWSDHFGSSVTTVHLGGSTDTWGYIWSPNDFSNNNFTVRISGGAYNAIYYLDSIKVKVYYTEPPPPSITNIGPTSGPAGKTQITITGSNFGEYTGTPGYVPGADIDCDGEVDFADFNTLANSYTGDHNNPGYRPEHYNPAADIQIGPDGPDGDVDFADFNTLANAYGTKCGSSYVKFANGVKGKVKEEDWSDTQLICTVPYPAETGDVVVVTENDTSNSINFTVENKHHRDGRAIRKRGKTSKKGN